MRLKLRFEYPVVTNQVVCRGAFKPRKNFVVDVQLKRVSPTTIDCEFILVDISTEVIYHVPPIILTLIPIWTLIWHKSLMLTLNIILSLVLNFILAC